MFDIRRAEAAWDRHNEAQLRSFLASEDRAAVRERELEEATSRHFKELLADPATLVEAIQESMWEEAQQAAVNAAFQDGDNAKLGAVVRGGITAYLSRLAARFAEAEVSKSQE